MDAVREPARDVPVVREADVVVAGGGVAGIAASLAAARTGARTLLIERLGFLGGTATAGLMTSFNGFRNERPPDGVQTVRGIAQEIVGRLLEVGGACGCTAHGNFGPLEPGRCPYAVSFDPEALKRVALEMLVEAGVEIMLHAVVAAAPALAGEPAAGVQASTFSRRQAGLPAAAGPQDGGPELVEGAAAPAEGRMVTAVVLETRSGREAVRGRVYVDATGDGDLAARAGARFEKVPRSGERMMPMTLMYRVSGLPEPGPGPGERRLWMNGLTTRWGPHVGEVDGTEADDLTRAEVEARREVAGHVAKLREEFPDAALVETAAVVGVRETRRVIGLYTISEEDVLSGRRQPDSVAVSSNPVPGYYGARRFLDHLGFEIPYRSLVPADLDNVVLAGRCISACQPAFQSARSMAPAMAVSQASGTAAAMCASRGCRPAELDAAELGRKLADDGAVVRVPREGTP